MKLTQFLLFFLVLSVLLGCKRVDEFQDADVISKGAEFAIPLIKAKTTIQDLLENFDEYTFIEITPDGVIHLRYKGDVFTQTADEFFKDAKDSIPPIIPLEDTLFALPFSSPQQLEIDFARYKSGIVRFAAKSTDYVGIIDFTMTILGATKNGQPAKIHQQFTSPTSGIAGYFISDSLNMSGYQLVPINDTLYIRYEAYTETGERLKLPEVALINENVDFSYIEGYLGNFNQKGKRDSIEIEFFQNWIQGDVFFEDPKIFIHIQNSFGIPTRSDIKTFEIITADGQTLPLESDFITGTGIDFVYPSLTAGEVGQTKYMTFEFNSSNSNIEEVLGSRPVALDYHVDAIMNPDSLTSIRGFITDSSYYKIQVEVDLPLHGRAAGFGVTDTFNIDFENYGDVEEAEFKIVADNTMPLDIDAQIFFVNEDGAVVDSLFSEGRRRIVGSAEVDSQGNVVSARSSTTFSDFTSSRFDEVRQAKKLVLQAFFSTFNEGQQSVRALSDQAVEIRMGMRIKT